MGLIVPCKLRVESTTLLGLREDWTAEGLAKADVRKVVDPTKARVLEHNAGILFLELIACILGRDRLSWLDERLGDARLT